MLIIQTYWSVENNSLGEAALIVIDEMDEDNLGEFLHEPKKRGIQKAIRKGFTTSYKTKITACMKMNRMESDKWYP